MMQAWVMGIVRALSRQNVHHLLRLKRASINPSLGLIIDIPVYSRIKQGAIMNHIYYYLKNKRLLNHSNNNELRPTL